MPGCTALTDNASYTTRLESTPGVDDGGDRDRIYARTIQYNLQDSTLVSGLKTGLSAVQAVRNITRLADTSLNTEFVFGLHEFLLEDALRGTFSGTSLSHTNVAAVTFDNAGTQISGATGPVITGNPGEFTPLIGSDGAMMVLTSATVNPQNLHPRRILEVDADQIDIMPEYVAGAPSQPGGPLINASVPLGELTITIGDMLYDNGSAGQRYRNFETYMSDVGLYQVVLGQMLSNLTMSIDGQSNWVMLAAEFLGLDWLPQGVASIGSGIIENDAIRNDPIAGGTDTAYFMVDGGSVELSGENLTNFSVAIDNSLVTTENVVGAESRTCVQGGDTVVTGSLQVLQEDVRLKLIQLRAYSDQYTTLDWRYTDTAGNVYWFGMPRLKFQGSGATDGEKGTLIDATFNYQAVLYDTNIRQFCAQRIPVE